LDPISDKGERFGDPGRQSVGEWRRKNPKEPVPEGVTVRGRGLGGPKINGGVLVGTAPAPFVKGGPRGPPPERPPRGDPFGGR